MNYFNGHGPECCKLLGNIGGCVFFECKKYFAHIVYNDKQNLTAIIKNPHAFRVLCSSDQFWKSVAYLYGYDKPFHSNENEIHTTSCYELLGTTEYYTFVYSCNNDNGLYWTTFDNVHRIEPVFVGQKDLKKCRYVEGYSCGTPNTKNTTKLPNVIQEINVNEILKQSFKRVIKIV